MPSSIHRLIEKYRRQLVEAIAVDPSLQVNTNIHFFGGSDGDDIRSPEHVVLEYLFQHNKNLHKYHEWLIVRYCRGDFFIEDHPRVSETIGAYYKYRQAMRENAVPCNLNQLSLSEVEEILKPFRKLPSERPIDLSTPDIVVHYNGEHGIVVSPLTAEASKKLGCGTNWCTASVKNNRFHDYHKPDDMLYIYQDPDGKKYQLHWGTVQFRKSSDSQIVPAKLKAFRENPALVKIFEERANWLAQKDFDKALAFMRKSVMNEYPALYQVALTDPDYASAYMWGNDVRDDRLEHALLGDPEECLIYAMRRLHGRFLIAEDVIMRTPAVAWRYANLVL